MSLLKTIRQQLGLSNTAANNFTLDASADDGTMKLARGNAGATTQDVLKVNASGTVSFPQNGVTLLAKKITTTSPSVVSGTVSVAHGLDSTKIIAAFVTINYGGTDYVPDGYIGALLNGNYRINVYWTSVNVVLIAASDAVAAALGKAAVITVLYEE